MKQMTKLENIIMNRSGCNRETANLIANDILQEVEKDLQAEVAREIFEEIERYAEPNLESLAIAENVEPRAKEFFGGGKQAFSLLLDKLSELKKKYTEGEPNG